MYLNKSQLAAVDHFNGPLLVLSGPGSGKTTVIVNRVARLIKHYKVPPENILVVTFTNSAATSMKKRFMEGFIDDNIRKENVTFGTLHSVFFSILRSVKGYDRGNIISSREKFNILKEVIVCKNRELVKTEKISIGTDNLKMLLNDISTGKFTGEFKSCICNDALFKEIYTAYNRQIKALNKLDFDDMLIDTLSLLKEDRILLEKLRNRYRYILIDEYQDINRVQNDIINLMAYPENNIFAVGDDDQAIYGFRGAKPDIMMNFGKQYRNAEIMELNINYRCNEEIVKASKRLISHNRNRFDKNIKAAGTGKEIRTIEICCCENMTEQCKKIVEFYHKAAENNIAPEKVAVLYRTNNSSVQLCQVLMHNNIDFQIKDGAVNIYENFMVKDLLAYIRIAAGSMDRSDYLKIISRPDRNIPRVLFENEKVDDKIVVSRAKTMLEEKTITYLQYESILKLFEDIKFIRKLNTYGVISYVKYGMGFVKHIDDNVKRIERAGENGEGIKEIISTIEEQSRIYDKPSHFLEFIDEYNVEISENKRKNDNGLVLSTIHGAKGLEYDMVMIMDVNEQIIPHGKAETKEDTEEERRLFYVAITRAAKKLIVFYTKTRYGKELPPSRFIGEMK